MGNYENTLFRPWNSLQTEFASLCASNTQCFSHMSQHRVRGAAHRDTILRSRGDQIVAKVPLTKLKLNNDREIADYFQPERDRLLYTALRKRLIVFGGNASEAFVEPFYKPKSNGLRGPLVKSVPIIQRPRSFVRVRGGIGINGDMIRIDIFLSLIHISTIESSVATPRFGITKLYPGLVSGYLCITGDLL